MGRSPSNSTSGEEGELPASPDDIKRDYYKYGRGDREKGNQYDSDEDVTRRREDDGRSHRSQNKDNDVADDRDEKKSSRQGRDENGRHTNGRMTREDNDRKGSRHRSDHYDIDSEKGHNKREFEEKYGAGKKGDDGYRKDKKKANEDERDEKRESRRGKDNSGKGHKEASDDRYRGRHREEESEGGDGNWKDEKKANENERYDRRESWKGRDDSEKEHKRKSDERYRGSRDREADSDGDSKGRSKANKDARDDISGSRRERNEHNEDKGRRRKEFEEKNEDSDSDSDWKNRRRGKEREREREKERERERVKRREDEAKDWRRHRFEGDEKHKREKDKKNRTQEENKNVEDEVDRGKVNVEPNVYLKPENLGRSGGVYIPPFKLARMMKEVEDKSSLEYQRMTWDALRKSINGLVNKVNAINIKNIIPELFAENLIRGRGLFCRSCMKSQMASPGFTDVFAALVAVANTKFPEIGELLLKRTILQFRRAFDRSYKPQLLAAVKFIAHLVNQQVVHELIALELLTVLLENPTDDSVEVAVGFVTECGSILQDLCPRGLHGIFERFRGILHEGEIDKRVQFLIEGLFALRKSKFQGYPAVRPELDLVEQEDQLTHEISLLDEIDPETALDIFKPDPNFLENEKKYEELKVSILGEESDDEADSDEGDSDDKDEEESEEEEERMKIQDETETNLVNLRRTIYLTIMSSVDFEEAGHKLLKIKLEPGQEMELCIMLLECCSQERTYLRYYGLLGQRFCMINKVHQVNFETCFVQQYSMIHRLETNKLRNVAKFFAHLLGTDALPWHVLSYIRLTEEDTTSSSRIFIKILFQELSEHLGIRLLNERLNDPTMQESFESIFPKDNPKNTRFSINFFTSIGLGGITENLREYLKNMPRLIMQQQKPASESEESGSDASDSSGSASSSSSDDSESKSDSGRDDKRRKRRRRT